MKKFFQKNLSVIIAILMVAGLAIFFFGLDWDQTQVAWKVPLATPMMILGGVMFVIGFILLSIANGSN